MTNQPTDNGAQRPDMATAIANEVYSYWEHMPGNEDGDFGPTWGVIKALVDQGIEKGKAAAEQTIATLREQLDEAERFILNGVEFGFIRLPNNDDPADRTYQAILTRHAEKGET